LKLFYIDLEDDGNGESLSWYVWGEGHFDAVKSWQRAAFTDYYGNVDDFSDHFDVDDTEIGVIEFLGHEQSPAGWERLSDVKVKVDTNNNPRYLAVEPVAYA
jgi:hypothetical protein